MRLDVTYKYIGHNLTRTYEFYFFIEQTGAYSGVVKRRSGNELDYVVCNFTTGESFKETKKLKKFKPEYEYINGFFMTTHEADCFIDELNQAIINKFLEPNE